MSLGAFDSGLLGETYYLMAAILFFLSTLFLCVIMLNLLIAVISETYVTVQESQLNTMYQTMCDLIVENKHLANKAALEEQDKEGDYIYIAKVDEADLQAASWKKTAANLRKTIDVKVGQIERNLYEFSLHVKETSFEGKSQFSTSFLKTSIRNELRFKKTLADISLMIGQEREDAPGITETPVRRGPNNNPLALTHNMSVV